MSRPEMAARFFGALLALGAVAIVIVVIVAWWRGRKKR